jgi:hypothetical protein
MSSATADIVFQPSRMPGMRRWRFELTDTHLALRNMRTWMPLPPFLIVWSPDVVIALSSISSAEVDPEPIRSIRRFSRVKGRKILPGVNPLVVCSLDEGRQFFAVRGGRPALAVNIEDSKLQRLTVTFPDPSLLVERIARDRQRPLGESQL